MSSYIVPVLAIFVILLGLFRRVDVYAAFSEGAGESLSLLVKILPYLAAMLVAIRMLRESGLFDMLTQLLAPLCSKFGMDAALLPLIFIRPFSGSASIAMFREICETYGPDTPIGRTAAILMGSSETIFYEIALYFGVIGIKKTRFALPVALAANLVSTVLAILLAQLFF